MSESTPEAAISTEQAPEAGSTDSLLLHLDGFDGPLDLRMEKSGTSAADIVNSWGEAELADTIFQLGEERHSRRVARAIVAARKEKRIERTSELAHIVRTAVPRSKDGIDPATRTFQALRIATNDELGELARGLAAAGA
jgi:16S rRNA (cytosine1402-N4)-methyltransferase